MRKSQLRHVLVPLALTILFIRGTAQERTVVRELSRAPLESGASAGLKTAVPPIWVVDERGFPVLSEAGYVQLPDEGPGFYYGALVQDRVDWARSIGMVGTNNWGDVEGFTMASRVVARWRKMHPDIRLGLDEISGRHGGFPDYDNDGVSDHLTHQVGHNFNFLIPCRTRPERYVHVGVQHESLFEPKLYSELIDLLVDEGAFRMTTHVDLMKDASASETLRSRFPWKKRDKESNNYSSVYGIEGRRVIMLLLTPKGDHADHVNVLFWKAE